MGRIYTVEFEDIAVTALQDLWELTAPSDGIVIVHGFEVFQTSDAGDAEEEILRLESVKGIGSVTSGSGGSAVTPAPIQDGDAAYGGTVERNNTTRMVAGAGSLVETEDYGWNVRIPLVQIWTPELRPVISVSDRWTLALPSAPNDSLTVSSKVYLEEIG